MASYAKLPDAFKDALGQIIADVRREARIELDRIQAEHRALLAELRAQMAERVAAENASVNGAVGRVNEALARVRDGRDGRDADPDYMRELAAAEVAKAIAERPIPERGEKGEPGKDADPDAIVEKVLALMPAPEKGEPGDPGPQGEKGDPGPAGEPLDLVKFVDEVMASLRIPLKGEPGKDGKDAEVDYQRIQDSIEATAAREVEEQIVDYIAHLPMPEKGEKGDPGEPGPRGEKGEQGEPGPAGDRGDIGLRGETGEPGPIGQKGEPGEPGRDGQDADPEVIKAVVADEIDRRMATLVIPKGEKGDPGDPGEPGARGEQGLPGKDGVGLAGMLVDRSGCCIATMTDGTVRELGPVVGRDGAPGEPGKDGKDGQDGLSFADFELEPEFDGERTLRLKWTNGGKEYVREWRLPIVIYRGVYKDGSQYECGDAVTFASAVWIALKATNEKPGDGRPDWRLAVKGGIPGASAYSIAKQEGFRGSQNEWLASLKGERGLTGRPGRDLTLGSS